MTRSRVMRLSVVILVLAFVAVSAQAQIGAVVSNWTVPSSSFSSGSSSTSSSSGLHHSQALGDVTLPVFFVGQTPCRIVDTRGPAGPYGAPSLPASTPRNFALRTGPCAGISAGAVAYSLNITVTNTLGPGFISLYPQGGAAPVVSTLNYVANQTIANAAIVPAGTGGGVTAVAGVSGTDLIIDINGYYVANPLNAGEPVTVVGSWPGGVLYGFNSNNAGFGVWGEIGNGTAVYGLTDGTGTDTNGVFGSDGAGATGALTSNWFSTGVRGEGKNGVLGITSTAGGDGVIGVAISPATVGVRTEGNFTATGTKAFVEPHPTNPALTIRYVALEGPEAGTYFRGTARTVNGVAVIQVPESFRMVTDNEGLTVQLTPVGELAQMAVIGQDLNQIIVRSSRDVSFHYQVNGIRHMFRDWQAVAEGNDFHPITATQKMPGWLTEEAKSRLIANGTYNADGTVNMNTAERMGWAKPWREDAAAAAAPRK
jgi:hypothetical protein